MAKNTNSMSSHFKEATGLRVVGMYVQEYFHWGWQQYDQQNDDGIDGEIIPRYQDGRDMGVRIFVQVKYGHSYYKSETDDTIYVRPYGTNKDRLTKHVNSWNRSQSPVLLIYVNADVNRKNRDKARLVDLKHPHAWWVRVDDYHLDSNCDFIAIPKINLFQEHSKGFLKKIIMPLLKSWENYPLIAVSASLLKLWNSGKVNQIAKPYYYQEWAMHNPLISMNKNQYPLIVSRVGWRHITLSRRKERIVMSKKLLPIAKQIITMSAGIVPVVLKIEDDVDVIIQYLGYRGRVMIEGNLHRVQVVVKHIVNTNSMEEKFWFYSVHLVI